MILFTLCITLVLNGSGAIQINYVKVPMAVRNNSNKPAILDCNYSVRPDDTELVVKWLLEGEVVYQWIPPQQPQSLGRLKNRVDLEYKASDDPKSVYRAMKILNPTNDIAGEYKCFVSTFADEDFSLKRMIVFEPEKSLEMTQNLADESRVNFTCFASEAFPMPKLAIYKDETDGPTLRSKLPTVQLDVSQYPNERFSVFIVASVLKESLTPGTLIHCELRIPGTGYVKSQTLLYYPEDLERNESEDFAANGELLTIGLLINVLFVGCF